MAETITYEVITTDRLDNYAEIVKEYKTLLKHKKVLIEKIGTLKGVDYSGIKVQPGNGLKTTEQEHYAMKLEQINSKIAEYEAWIPPEKEIIKTQIARVRKRDYRKLLVLRYIEKWKWKEIIQEFFEFEIDYEDQKQTKYKDTIMYWNRRALEELKKVSEKPYIPWYPQLPLFNNNQKG